MPRRRVGAKVVPPAEEAEEALAVEQDVASLPWLFWWEKAFLGLVAIALASQTALWSLGSELHLFGDSERLERRELPTFHTPEEGSLLTVRDERAGAVVTVSLLSGEKVRFQMNAPGGAEGHERLPDFFYEHTVYGISAWDPPHQSAGNRSYNLAVNVALAEELSSMWPPPDDVLRCHFENAALGWRAEGFCPCYSKAAHTSDAESRMRIAARRYHQPAVYKWWPHRWGRASTGRVEDGATIMQRTVPTAPELNALTSSGPVWRV